MQKSYSDHSEFRGWSKRLLEMMQFIGATAEQLPVFHTEEQICDGKRYHWKAWINLVPLAYKPDTECQFVGQRYREREAIQDAARQAVLHLRQHYDSEFEHSEYQLIPQRGSDGSSFQIPCPGDDEDPRIREVATHVLAQEILYTRVLKEYQKVHQKYHLAKHGIKNMRRELDRYNEPDQGTGSICDESPDVPEDPTVEYTLRSPDYTPLSPVITPESPPGARPHPTGIARFYRRRFRGSNKGKEKMEEATPSQQVTKTAKEEKKEDSEEEEDPEMLIHYTTSNPPSSGW